MTFNDGSVLLFLVFEVKRNVHVSPGEMFSTSPPPSPEYYTCKCGFKKKIVLLFIQFKKLKLCKIRQNLDKVYLFIYLLFNLKKNLTLFFFFFYKHPARPGDGVSLKNIK